MFNLPIILKHVVTIVLLDVISHSLLQFYGRGVHFLLNTYLVLFVYGSIVFMWGYGSLCWSRWGYRYHFHFGFALIISGILGSVIPVEVVPSIVIWAVMFIGIYLLSSFLFPKIFVFVDNFGGKWEIIPTKRLIVGVFILAFTCVYTFSTDLSSNMTYLSLFTFFIGILLIISSHTLKRGEF